MGSSYISTNISRTFMMNGASLFLNFKRKILLLLDLMWNVYTYFNIKLKYFYASIVIIFSFDLV